jgi:hypothetical protein
MMAQPVAPRAITYSGEESDETTLRDFPSAVVPAPMADTTVGDIVYAATVCVVSQSAYGISLTLVPGTVVALNAQIRQLLMLNAGATFTYLNANIQTNVFKIKYNQLNEFTVEPGAAMVMRGTDSGFALDSVRNYPVGPPLNQFGLFLSVGSHSEASKQMLMSMDMCGHLTGMVRLFILAHGGKVTYEAYNQGWPFELPATRGAARSITVGEKMFEVEKKATQSVAVGKDVFRAMVQKAHYPGPMQTVDLAITRGGSITVPDPDAGHVMLVLIGVPDGLVAPWVLVELTASQYRMAIVPLSNMLHELHRGETIAEKPISEQHCDIIAEIAQYLGATYEDLCLKLK